MTCPSIISLYLRHVTCSQFQWLSSGSQVLCLLNWHAHWERCKSYSHIAYSSDHGSYLLWIILALSAPHHLSTSAIVMVIMAYKTEPSPAFASYELYPLSLPLDSINAKGEACNMLCMTQRVHSQGKEHT